MMRPAAWILAVSPLVASLPASTPSVLGTKFPWLETQISNLEVDCARIQEQVPYTCNIRFDFYDPNSELVQEVNGARCDVSWTWDGTATERGPGNNYVEGFTVCSISKLNLFQVQISRFHSASDWTILVSHKYRDDLHFKEPLNTPNSFSQFDIPKLHPNESEEELGRFNYGVEETIQAPVVGLT